MQRLSQIKEFSKLNEYFCAYYERKDAKKDYYMVLGTFHIAFFGDDGSHNFGGEVRSDSFI